MPTDGPANSVSADACATCGVDLGVGEYEYYWTSANQCVECDEPGLYVGHGAVVDDSTQACERACETTTMATITMTNSHACATINIDSIYSNVGGDAAYGSSYLGIPGSASAVKGGMADAGWAALRRVRVGGHADGADATA